MLLLSEIRDLIAGLNIIEDENVYSGKLDNKKDKAIGIYHRKEDLKPIVAIGGYNMSSYAIKPISILVHYGKNQIEAEKKSVELFNLLKDIKNMIINNKKIFFTQMLMSEPQSVDTDDSGIYEYVIWVNFIYERS